MTNKEFAEQDQGFKKACKEVNLPKKLMTLKCGSRAISVDRGALGLGRQAGKWRRKEGSAWNEWRKRP